MENKAESVQYRDFLDTIRVIHLNNGWLATLTSGDRPGLVRFGSVAVTTARAATVGPIGRPGHGPASRSESRRRSLPGRAVLRSGESLSQLQVGKQCHRVNPRGATGGGPPGQAQYSGYGTCPTVRSVTSRRNLTVPVAVIGLLPVTRTPSRPGPADSGIERTSSAEIVRDGSIP